MGDLRYLTLTPDTAVDICDRIIPKVLGLQGSLIASRDSTVQSSGFLISAFEPKELLNLVRSDGMLVCAISEHDLMGFCLTTPITEFTDLFENSDSGKFVAQEPLRLTPANHRYLYQIAVTQSQAGKGTGKALLDFAKKKSTGVTLLTDVLTSPIENAASRRFFRKNGFKPVGELTLQSYRNFGELRSEVLLCQ